MEKQIFNGYISYWFNEYEIDDISFNEQTLDIFEEEYGKLDQDKIIAIHMELA